jgi:hypothetical protein
MPERWQRELKRLGRAEPRTELWTRVEQGPRGPSTIPGRQRLLAGGVAFAVFIAAGLFAWNVFRPAGTVIGDTSVLSPSPGDLVVTLRAPTQRSTATDLHLPTAVFRLGDTEANIATQGMTGWPDIPIAGFNDPLYRLNFKVPAGTRLVIQGDATSTSARVRNGIPIDSATQVLDLSAGSALLPSDTGQYVIDLTGNWAEGTATFTAVFDIVPVAQPAVLAFDERDPQIPRLSFTVVGAMVPVFLGTHSWTLDGANGNADAMMPTFTDADPVQVVRGTPLLVQSPPSTVSIMANEGLVMNYGPKIDLSAPGATFDLPQGQYLVIIYATWDDAQAQFWLPIEIVDRQVPTSAEVTHNSHPAVARSVSGMCPAVGAKLTADATSAAPGDRVTLSGPIYHRAIDGSYVLSPTEDYQAWWGIASERYTELGTTPFSIASGDEIVPPPSGPRMLGDDRPNGACGFDITLVVPDVAPGPYDVTVISADAEGDTSYGTLTIEVLPPTSRSSA